MMPHKPARIVSFGGGNVLNAASQQDMVKWENL